MNGALDKNMHRVYSSFIENKYRNFAKNRTTYKIREEYLHQKQKEKKLSEEKLNNIMVESKSL